jgi:hypothetical protein
MANRSQRNSRLHRVIHVICAVFVVFYILFDVLDLDGSDFPLNPAPLEKAFLTAEVPKEIKQELSLTETDGGDAALSSIILRQAFPVPLTRSCVFTVLQFIRVHHYRIALPRSAPADPSASA